VNTHSSRLRLLLPLAAAGSLIFAACGDDDTTTDDTTAPPSGDSTAPPSGGGELTVGSANFPESELLAQIYGQALAAAGFDVSFENSIGPRETYYAAVADGDVDLVPEYTNSLLSFVLRLDDPEANPEPAESADDQVTQLNEVLPDGLEVLTPSTAEDKDVLVCNADAAEEFGLAALPDLADTEGLTIGAPPEFETRSPFGLVGFQELYGFEVGEFVPLEIGPPIAAALGSGAIDCGNLFSTMSVITTEGFVPLEDTDDIVPFEAVLPLVRSEVVDDALTSTLDAVNADLDTDVLKELMVQVEVDALGPDVVAEEWLVSR
jgi:osmoprotectant transport system substrate-binding protein